MKAKPRSKATISIIINYPEVSSELLTINSSFKSRSKWVNLENGAHQGIRSACILVGTLMLKTRSR